MIIQHNIAAMNSYRSYRTNNKKLSGNLEKLSSGYKINRAGDDAAGLAISEKMRAQITGLEGAQKNAKDGISLVQTAEGALTEVHDMLNRMYSLAEQSANGTYDISTDRNQLQKEVDSLRDEINRIADSANFNGLNLLDGSLQMNKDNYSFTVTEQIPGLGIYDIDLSNAGIQSTGQEGLVLGFSYAKVTDEGTWEQSGSQTDHDGIRVQVSITNGQHYTAYISRDIKAGDKFTAYKMDEEDAGEGKAVHNVRVTIAFDLDATDTTTNTVDNYNGSYSLGPNVNFKQERTGRSLTLQVGDTGEAFNQLTVAVRDIHADEIGIGGVDVGTQKGAQLALSKIKAAINVVSDVRGGLGAIQNRLDHTINNLAVMQENIQDAESTIRDTDVAEEMMKYTKNNILNQSAQAMLAQANQLPQGALQLLQ